MTVDLAHPEVKAALYRWVSYRLDIPEADIMDAWIAQVVRPNGVVVKIEVCASYLHYGERRVRKFDSTEDQAYASIEALMQAMSSKGGSGMKPELASGDCLASAKVESHE